MSCSAYFIECLDMTVLIKGIACHVDACVMALMISLTLDTTEMDGLLLQVVLRDIDNREPVHGEQVFICRIPNSASSRRRVIQAHTHTGLLQSLTGEDVNGKRLHDFSGSIDYLLAALVGSLNPG